MSTLLLDRKGKEAVFLALLSITAVAVLRFPVESRALFIAELLSMAAVFVANLLKDSRGFTSVASATSVPIGFAIIARAMGLPIAYEMTALTVFGTVSLALANRERRLRAMSLVASGFLTLFAVAISDSPRAVWFAIAWMTICVWHLVANHWERLELCSVENVRRERVVRPASVLGAVAICIVSGLVLRDGFGASNRFAFGVMPSSGGSQWSDPAARSGVGSGDAAIAAKDHAESFGAVESDLFLESTESTLFDMFSDSIGEPKKKVKSERRQGMASEKVLEAHTNTAKSEKGGGSFTTDRLPAKKHLHLEDAAGPAIVQWAGPTGIRLAMNRYDAYDGIDWTNAAQHRNEKLVRRESAGTVWFCDPAESLDESMTQVNLLKVLRLSSTRLPVPMRTSAVHIKDVDRQDFFGIEDDGSWYMPGRERVPELTVVNVASTTVLEDELWDGLVTRSASGSVGRSELVGRNHSIDTLAATASDPSASVSTSVGPNLLTSLAGRWTEGSEHPYEKVQAIISHLRTEFVFDRLAEPSSSDPVDAFLRSGRGGDHLFATTAALMAREIGLQSRLVTGFYVRPSAIDITAGHTDVFPDDVHVWAEIRLSDGRWFEIEPTPEFQEPVYRPSTWLVAKQFAAAKWPHMLGILAIVGLLFVSRMLWIELGLSILYPLGAMLWPRGRMVLAMRVLQTRAKYAGCPRVAGLPQRDWLLAITSTQDSLHKAARRFCDAADRSAFATGDNHFQEHTVSRELLMKLKIRVLRQLSTEATT